MTALRILATTDLAAALVPMRATYGQTGTVSGVADVLEHERAHRPAIWLDAGDLTVGPASVLLDERPWDEMGALPIACTAAGNHDFDEGLDALRAGARRLRYPMLCANVDVGLPATALLDTPAGPLGVIGLAHPCGPANVVGESAEQWTTRTGADHYLPDRIAHAFRTTSGADAAFAPPAHHGSQAPLDGVMAQLPAGPVTELDLVRLFPADDYGPVVAELEAGEWERLVAHHTAVADPANASTDDLWWNWCRMPAGTSTSGSRPASVAMVAGNVPLVSEWLDRELSVEPSPVSARDALLAA